MKVRLGRRSGNSNNNKTKANSSETTKSMQDKVASAREKYPPNRKKSKAWRKAISDDEDDDDVASNFSDLSDSTNEDTDPLGSVDERSEDYQQFEKALRRKHSRACKAMSSGSYQNALADFESILSDLLARYGERHERVGAALHNVAIANLRAGSLDDAMDAIEEAIKIRSRALGRSHPKVADSLVELGIILLSMDEHEDALKVFERALKLRRDEIDKETLQEEIDESNLKIAKVLNNIGCVNFEQNNLDTAQSAFDEAIRLQKRVFKNIFTMLCGVDVNSPGILTMASTMCNRAYVAIERQEFDEAIALFLESLQIQRSILGAENKLVQTSLDNMGYAHAMLGQYDKALNVFNEIWGVLEASKTPTPSNDRIYALRRVVICQVRLQRWAAAFEKLEMLEDIQQDADADQQSLLATRRLMGDVNYQILKLPSLSNATNRALGCAVLIGPDEEDISMDSWCIEKPENTSKMSGHRVTHA